MKDKRFVASNRDIILFFIISTFYSIIYYIGTYKPSIENNIKYYINFRYVLETIFEYHIKLILEILLVTYIPEIIAIIINKLIEYFNIQNKILLKVTKIIFNIFTFIYFIFMGLVACFFADVPI